MPFDQPAVRLQIFSDLHLERYPGFAPVFLPDVDVIVLAGDIGSYQDGSRLGGDDFGLARFSPLLRNDPSQRVLFVPGNHEYDALEYRPTYARLQAICRELGIDWLEQTSLVIGEVRFVGSTLWSDFDALASAEAREPQRVQAREKAFRAANYYLRKNTMLVDGAPLLAEGIRMLGLESQAWLKTELMKPFDGKTVVVTHFAPSLRSADPRYGLTPGTAGFCNALDELLAYADLWVHGHLHCYNDYLVETAAPGERRTCRVIANPLGYVSKGEQAAFREGLVVTL